MPDFEKNRVNTTMVAEGAFAAHHKRLGWLRDKDNPSIYPIT